MRSLCFPIGFLAATSVAATPYFSADIGKSIPMWNGGAYRNPDVESIPESFDVDWSGEGEGALSWGIGAGFLIPISESIQLDAWGAYSSVPYSAKHTMKVSGTDNTTDGTTGSIQGRTTVDIDVTTSLVEFGGGVRWSANPVLGLGCGFQFSHVSESEFDGKVASQFQYEISGTTNESIDGSEKRSIDGDLDDIEEIVGDETEDLSLEGFETRPQDFFSLRLSADFAIMPNASVLAGYLYPLIDHLDGKTLNGTLQRAFVGLRWRFGDH